MPSHELVLEGMQSHFLGNTEIKRLIASRLYRVASETWIVALEDLNSAKTPRPQMWAEYALSGGPRFKVLKGESSYRRASVEFRFYGWMNRHAVQLYQAFYDAMTTEGIENNWRGTWNGVRVREAFFDPEAYSEGYDDTLRVATVNVILSIVYMT